MDESASLGMYPVETLAEMLREVGNVVESEAFDALYEKTVEVMRQRRSDGEAGNSYVERASQKLQHEKPYDAIRWFGRAEELLLRLEDRRIIVIESNNHAAGDLNASTLNCMYAIQQAACRRPDIVMLLRLS